MSKELTPLKALQEIGKLKESDCYINTTEEYKLIEAALKRLEKIDHDMIYQKYMELDLKYRGQKEVLKIIKEKQVDVEWLIESENVEEYNDYISYVERYLAQEEYDLLKEWLSE